MSAGAPCVILEEKVGLSFTLARVFSLSLSWMPVAVFVCLAREKSVCMALCMNQRDEFPARLN